MSHVGASSVAFVRLLLTGDPVDIWPSVTDRIISGRRLILGRSNGLA